MFLKTVLADGTAEQTVIREMKARAAGARGDIEQIVRGVMADVQERGWDAVVEYAEKFDGKAPYIVEPSVLDAAYDACDPKLISALEKAAANIRDYHEQMLVKSWEWKRSAGETLGQTVRGLARVGIYVPGGTAAYPSSVLMNAIPAKVAGVGELIMVTPPTENMSNEVLAAAKIAGVDKVIAIGGTQAIAALTYGAGFIPQVDKIVGPGNAFVAAAKKLAFGTVDIDMIAGPSEVLVIADHTANPTYVAADLLSQAEHDRLASAVLLTDSMAQAQAISCEMERQAKLLPRWDIIKESVANYGCAIVFDSVMTLQNAIDLRRLGFSRWWLILLLAVLGPAAGLDLSDLTVRYEDLSRDMEQQAETYRREGQAQLELGIRQRTAAYISEKAAQLGLSCHPRVEVTWRGGVPYPGSVTLDMAENRALSAILEEDLGIPPSEQHWLG